MTDNLLFFDFISNSRYLGAVSSLVKEEEISLDELKQLIRDVEKAHE